MELKLAAGGSACDEIHRRNIFAFLEGLKEQDEGCAVLHLCFFGVCSEGEQRKPLEIVLGVQRAGEACKKKCKQVKTNGKANRHMASII